MPAGLLTDGGAVQHAQVVAVSDAATVAAPGARVPLHCHHDGAALASRALRLVQLHHRTHAAHATVLVLPGPVGPANDPQPDGNLHASSRGGWGSTRTRGIPWEFTWTSLEVESETRAIAHMRAHTHVHRSSNPVVNYSAATI